MKKLILILTLCIFTSLTVATSVAAANAPSCTKSTNNVKIYYNNDKDLQQVLSDIVSTNYKNVKVLSNCNLPTSSVKKSTYEEVCKPVVTATPTSAPKPVVTAVPTSTPKPVVTAVPTSTPKPVVTTAPTSKPKPVVTTAPTSAPKPAATTAPTSAPKPAATTAPTNTSGNYTAFQKSIVQLVNKERAAVGLNALTENADLDKVATLKSQDMVNLNYFDHTSPTYGSPFDMITQFGIPYSYAGENIAYGQTSPEDVMNGWMNSPGHKANILNSNFTQIGVGVAKKANGQYVWTQTFTRP